MEKQMKSLHSAQDKSHHPYNRRVTSLISMESSALTSLNMKKRTIIAENLNGLSEISWTKFKKTLCRMKPSGKAEGIKMRCLTGKSKECVVELIFKYYTERCGPGRIKRILEEIGENEIRNKIQRELREASKGMKDMQMCSTRSSDAIPKDNTVSSSKPPVKKRQQDKWVPGIFYNIEQNVNKKEGSRPAQKQPKQEISCNIQQNVNKKSGPGGHREPQPQVNPEQGNIMNNILQSAPDKLFGTVNSSTSSKEPQSQVTPEQGHVISNIIHTAPNKQSTVASSHSSSKEPQPQVNPIQGNITRNMPHTAPNKRSRVAPSHASSKGWGPLRCWSAPVAMRERPLTERAPTTTPSLQEDVPPVTERSQPPQSLPNTSMEKETRNILATHLKTLGEGGIVIFKETLCSIEPPFKRGKIQTRDIKDKSVEDMVDLIIRRHTIKHARATVRKVLLLMKENNVKMAMEKAFRKLIQQSKEKKKVIGQ